MKRAGTAIVLALLGLALYELRFVLLPFLFGAGLAFVTQPVARWLETRRLPRLAAVLLTFFAVLALLIAVGFWAATGLKQDVTALATNAPEHLDHFIAQFLGGEKVHVFGHTIVAKTLAQNFTQAATSYLSQPGKVLGVVITGFEGALGVILSLLFFFYFLKDGPRLVHGAVGLTPPAGRERLSTLLERVSPLLFRYLRGLLIIITFGAVAAYIGLGLILGLRHAVLLSILVGVLELIPVIGPLTSAVSVGLIAIEQAGATVILGVALFFIALRLSIDQFLGPLALGRAGAVHPTMVLFAFLAGAVFFGPLGLLIAVPTAATVKVVLRELYGEAPDSQEGEERKEQREKGGGEKEES
jgi:predicted PurR-regulated permease PerM